MENILLTVHVFLSIGIIALVLIQRTDSDGMSGLSGGGGGNMNSLLTGRGAANLLTRTTAILATCFFITSLALTYVSNAKSSKSILDSTTTTTDVIPESGSTPLENQATTPAKEESPTVPMAK